MEQERAAEGLMRWSVVPPSFRSLLPEAHKSRDSHDIVLLCTRCHEVCVAPYAAHRRALFAAHQARSLTDLRPVSSAIPDLLAHPISP